MEKRRFSRVPFKTLAIIIAKDNNNKLEGEVKNISLAGMLLSCEQEMPPDTDLSVEIFLDGGNEKINIKIDGRVVRIVEQNLAIEFNLTGVSLDAISHLRQLISYNLGDGDQVIDEYLKNIKED